MVRAKMIACNIGALLVLAILIMPTTVKAQACGPQPCVKIQPCVKAVPCPQPVPCPKPAPCVRPEPCIKPLPSPMPCPKPCPPPVVVEKVVQCSPCPQFAVLSVPCNQMAINKVLSNASRCKVRRPMYRGACMSRCLSPCGRWWAGYPRVK